MSKSHDATKYDLYEYTSHPHYVVNDADFLTALNSMHGSATSHSHTTRKLLAKSVTMDQAESMLRGAEVVTYRPYTFPSGANGTEVCLKTYTLERYDQIMDINPDLDVSVVYHGTTYRPVDASSHWAAAD